MVAASHLRWGIVALVVCVAVGGGWRLWNPSTESDPVNVIASTATSPHSQQDVSDFIGVEACAACHLSQMASYRQTAHASAFELVNEDNEDEEPPDQKFVHVTSGRTYEVYRRQGQLRHRESLVADDGRTVIAGDYPVKFRVGSGHHSRTYVVDIDGFLMESPITFYASRQTWDMSPGYDSPHPLGFERAADYGCLVCHLGRAERQDGSLNRLNIREHAVGCENCHGAGRAHAEHHQSAQSPGNGTPDPIVHPGKLDRERAEAVCAQCHLRGVATVYRRGLDLDAFEPGMTLTDVRADYRVQRDDDRMNVTGHFDQLWLSRCYTESQLLTCTTCHNPHQPPDQPMTVQMHRQRCLECHTDQSCGIASTDERRTAVADNCNHCHMPQVPTDIPHIAFTHHRIGIHEGANVSEPPPADDLESFLDLAGWSTREQQRALALAYLEVAPRPIGGPSFEERAIPLLQRALSADPDDTTVASALARLAWAQQSPAAINLAQHAIDTGATTRDRANALLVLGSLQLSQGRFLSAQAALDELVTLRRHSEDWLLLGDARLAQDQIPKGLAAIERAARINPFRPELHAMLADLYTRLGRREDAVKQREIFDQLLQATSSVER